MASDDLIRIVYRPKRMSTAPGTDAAPADKAVKAVVRRNRTSISMDPDLYDTFVLIEGDARAARFTLRKWATEADATRAERSEAVGVSRLVHKQMLSKIRDVVRAGLTVIHKTGAAPGAAPVDGQISAGAAASGSPDDIGAAWDNFSAPGAEAKKAIKKAKTTSKKAPSKKEKSIPAAKAAAVEQGAEVVASAQRPAGMEGLMDEPAAADVAHAGGDEWTREREPGAEGPDPFM